MARLLSLIKRGRSRSRRVSGGHTEAGTNSPNSPNDNYNGRSPPQTPATMPSSTEQTASEPNEGHEASRAGEIPPPKLPSLATARLQSVTANRRPSGELSRETFYREYRASEPLETSLEPAPKSEISAVTTTLKGARINFVGGLETRAKPQLEIDEESMFPYENANPCPTCKSLTLSQILVWKKGSSREVSGGGCQHHANWSALDDSASSGYRLCVLIRDALLASIGDESYLRKISPKYSIHIRPEVSQGGFRFGPIGVDLSTNYSDSAMNQTAAYCAIGMYTDIDNNLYHQLWCLLYSCILGDPAANLIHGRRLSRIPNLPRILYEVKRWMACRNMYKEPLTELPKRVIDLTSSSDPLVVNLREVNESPGDRLGRYVCLSHRWGQTTKPLTTTTLTSASRIQGIKLRDLTKTFRNAIAITRRLGIKYIWIDSLCILQNSRNDWEEESSKMGQYYKSSWLTIGAGMTEDGLFSERIAPIKPYCKLDLQSESANMPQSAIYFSQEPHTMPIRAIDSRNQSPLYSRGWTLQEEILSPRFLSFEPTQVYFRCAEYVDFECGYRMTLNIWKSFGEQHLKSKDLWVRIIEDFSSRTLTVNSDKLPALSGLAHVYEETWKDEYLAGLWKNELWKHLLWYAKIPGRNSEYLGPSWSWVSVNSPVLFAGNKFAEPCMELVEASTKTVGKNPLGRVEGGVMIIHAPVAQFHVRTSQSEVAGQGGQTTTLHTPSGEICKFEPDEPMPRDLREVTFVYITDAIGLALLPETDTPNTFRRIGLGFVPNEGEPIPRKLTISVV